MTNDETKKAPGCRCLCHEAGAGLIVHCCETPNTGKDERDAWHVEQREALIAEHDKTAQILAGPTGTSGEWASMDTAAWAAQRMREIAYLRAKLAKAEAEARRVFSEQKAPERVFVALVVDWQQCGDADALGDAYNVDGGYDDVVEYVRADLHQAIVAERGAETGRAEENLERRAEYRNHVVALAARVVELEGLRDEAVSIGLRHLCPHEETKRGGAIWTICVACGAQGADDCGGLKASPDIERLESLLAPTVEIKAKKKAGR